MAEALGIAGSLISILELCMKVTIYVKTAKGAAKQKAELKSEIESLAVLIGGLYDSPDNEGWKETMTHLVKENGPLHILETKLSSLTDKLAPRSGRGRHKLEVLAWPFEEKEVNDTIQLIERQKSTLSLLLNNETRLI